MAAPRKENVKQVILDATYDLLKTRALADISLAEIASASGISKGTLYYHYKTKSEIFFDITDRYLSEQWDDFIAWTENKDKDTSLNRLVKYVVERNIVSASLRMQLLSEAQLGDQVLREKLLHRYSQFQQLISQKIAERTDIPADFLTWLILLLSDGIIVQEALQSGDFNREEFLTQGIRALRDLDRVRKERKDPGEQ